MLVYFSLIRLPFCLILPHIQSFPKKMFWRTYFLSVLQIICLSCMYKANWKPKYPAGLRTEDYFMPVLHKKWLSGPTVSKKSAHVDISVNGYLSDWSSSSSEVVSSRVSSLEFRPFILFRSPTRRRPAFCVSGQSRLFAGRLENRGERTAFRPGVSLLYSFCNTHIYGCHGDTWQCKQQHLGLVSASCIRPVIHIYTGVMVIHAVVMITPAFRQRKQVHSDLVSARCTLPEMYTHIE